jgi:hypothetical protein
MSAKLRFKFEPRCLLADVGRPVLSQLFAEELAH